MRITQVLYNLLKGLPHINFFDLVSLAKRDELRLLVERAPTHVKEVLVAVLGGCRLANRTGNFWLLPHLNLIINN